jgi:hypothetical protein
MRVAFAGGTHGGGGVDAPCNAVGVMCGGELLTERVSAGVSR